MALEDVPVDRLMTDQVVTVTPGTRLTDAAETMLAHGIGSLVVVDDDARLVGVLTGTDFLDIIASGRASPDATVEQYMTDQVVTAGVGDDIGDAAAAMITNDIQHLPVVDADAGVVGMLSTTDLTAYLSYERGTDV